LSVFVTSSTFLLFLEAFFNFFAQFTAEAVVMPSVCTPKRVKQKAAGRWRLERQGVPHPCSRPASPAFNLAWHGCVYLSTGSGTAFILTTLVVVAFGWRSPVFGSILRRKGCLHHAIYDTCICEHGPPIACLPQLHLPASTATSQSSTQFQRLYVINLVSYFLIVLLYN